MGYAALKGVRQGTRIEEVVTLRAFFVASGSATYWRGTVQTLLANHTLSRCLFRSHIGGSSLYFSVTPFPKLLRVHIHDSRIFCRLINGWRFLCLRLPCLHVPRLCILCVLCLFRSGTFVLFGFYLRAGRIETRIFQTL